MPFGLLGTMNHSAVMNNIIHVIKYSEGNVVEHRTTCTSEAPISWRVLLSATIIDVPNEVGYAAALCYIPLGGGAPSSCSMDSNCLSYLIQGTKTTAKGRGGRATKTQNT